MVVVAQNPVVDRRTVKNPTAPISVTFLVALSDHGPAPERIVGVELSVTPLGGGTSILVRTDSVGEAAIRLMPGRYRIRSLTRVERAGAAYDWDVEAAVRASDGSLVVSLNRQNASSAGGATPVAPGSTVIQAQPFEPNRPTAPPPEAQYPQTRQGFWFNIGFGYGSLGCDNCSGREGGFTGGLSLGGTLSQKVLFGVGTAGWSKSEGGATLTVGTLDARIRFYPSATGGFFLTGGLGVGTISAALAGFGSSSVTGVGVVLGLGIDFRVGKNLSLTPFWNGFAVRSSTSDVNVGQLGLGLTVH